MNISTIVWIGVVLLFAVLEAATVGLVCIWFALGAVAALLVSTFTSSLLWQIGTFVVVSALALALTRPFVKRQMSARVATNAELNVGKKAEVIVAITPDRSGRVRLEGVDWRAESEEELPVGSLCVVCRVEGATLKVQPDAAYAKSTSL